ncbi:MAG TPA: DUF6412 domain-containing protein [Micromonosporaceae bacterium]|jgi:hypothetical protein|nr:DUF6412 domain-containing protein [Micromonosporaceae bacterium]
MSATNAYLKAALVGLAVVWAAAALAGPSGAIASAAVAALVLAIAVAVRRHAGDARVPVRIRVTDPRRGPVGRGTLRHSDPDAPGHARPRAPGRFPSAD